MSLDYVVGKTSVEVDTKTLRRLQDIQKLNDQDKTTVLEMVDAFLRDRKTKNITQTKNTNTAQVSGFCCLCFHFERFDKIKKRSEFFFFDIVQ